MKISPRSYRCPLGQAQPHRTDVEVVKRDGWRTQRILVVDVSDTRLDMIEQAWIRRIGERLYGANK